MSAAKHTPGPWVVSIENDGDGPFEVRAPPYIVARVFSDPGHYTPDNARLIAAAPDLLTACERVIDAMKDHVLIAESMEGAQTQGREICALLNAAIAKARGAA